MKTRSYRIQAALHNGLDFELYGRLTDAQAKTIADKLDSLYDQRVIKEFLIGQGSNILPPQTMVIELSEKGLDAEIDRQILMLKDLDPM